MANIPSPINAGVAPQKRPGAGEQLLLALASQAPSILFDVLKYRTDQGQTDAANKAAMFGLNTLYQQNPDWFPAGFDPTTVDPRGAATVLQQAQEIALTKGQVTQAGTAAEASKAATEASRAQTKTEEALRPGRAEELRSRTGLTDIQAKVAGQEFKFNEAVRPFRERSEQLQPNLILAQIQGNEAEARKINAEIAAAKQKEDRELTAIVEETYQTERARVASLTAALMETGQYKAPEAKAMALNILYDGAANEREMLESIRARYAGNYSGAEAVRKSIISRGGLTEEQATQLDVWKTQQGSAQAVIDDMVNTDAPQEAIEKALVYYTANGDKATIPEKTHWLKRQLSKISSTNKTSLLTGPTGQPIMPASLGSVDIKTGTRR